jgi:hypothetical protein
MKMSITCRIQVDAFAVYCATNSETVRYGAIQSKGSGVFVSKQQIEKVRIPILSFNNLAHLNRYYTTLFLMILCRTLHFR